MCLYCGSLKSAKSVRRFLATTDKDARVTDEFAEKASVLKVVDLDAVDELMKPNSGTLGFLPRAAIEDHLQKEWVLGAKTPDGRLVGYLMYAANRDRLRIAHLCVSETHRGQGIARMLLGALKASATTQKIITLRCRNDFPANEMWRKLGFVPIAESPGRSKEGHLLTLWRLPLARLDQLELFRANLSDDVLDAVINSQIFFDFDRPDCAVTQPSKALVSDLFVDSVSLWYTDELLSEIGRNPCASDREEARTRLSQFSEVRHDPLLVESFAAKLSKMFPGHSTNQQSDIMPLAKTAASEIDIFVTRDRQLLNKAAQIDEAVNVRVLSPTGLIIELRELSEKQPHKPDYVSGLGLSWRRLTPGELMTFPFDRFLDQGERLGELETKVNTVLSDTPATEIEVLWSRDEPVAMLGLVVEPSRTLTVSLCRVAKAFRTSPLGSFPILDAINRAVAKGFEVLTVEESAISLEQSPNLSEMGFTRCTGGFIRFCFTRFQERESVLAEIRRLAPDCAVNYENMSGLDLERSCSPLISDAAQNYFLIPIKPGFARNLVDRHLSSSDMFGGDPDVLLRWRNVYYRASTRHKMLTAPGRILWYVSGSSGEIAAVSHLENVVLETPKELFRKFKRYGTFEWRNLYDLCGGDISKNVMALLFSHTFPLRRRVPLDEVREVFGQDDVGLTLQSPSKIEPGTFLKLFSLGFPELT